MAEKQKLSSNKKMPTGAKVIAVLLIIYGLFVFLGGITIVRAIGGGYELQKGVLYATFFFAIAALSFISACGLFRLKKWAKILTVFVSIVVLVKLFAGYFTGANAFQLMDLIYILFFLIVIYYLLFNKKIKGAFK